MGKYKTKEFKEIKLVDVSKIKTMKQPFSPPKIKGIKKKWYYAFFKKEIWHESQI